MLGIAVENEKDSQFLVLKIFPFIVDPTDKEVKSTQNWEQVFIDFIRTKLFKNALNNISRYLVVFSISVRIAFLILVFQVIAINLELQSIQQVFDILDWLFEVLIFNSLNLPENLREIIVVCKCVSWVKWSILFAALNAANSEQSGEHFAISSFYLLF